MSVTGDFIKYSQRGAYHWNQVSRSLIRHNVYVSARYKKILAHLGNIDGKAILDVGGGDGALSYLIARNQASPSIVDVSLEGLQYAISEFRKRGLPATCIQASAEKLPIQDGSYDAVVASEVIEHLSKPGQFLSEASRILRANGILVLTTPLRLSEKPVSSEHEREYFAGELTDLLEDFFINVKVDPFAPVFWFETIYMRPKIFAEKPVFLYLLNFLELYLGKNMLLVSSRFRYFCCLVAYGLKRPR